MSTLILASLAIAIVIPYNKLSVLSGLIDAFQFFFNSYHLYWLMPLILILIIIGGLGGLSTWIIGPVRGLNIALQEGNLLWNLQKVNRQNMPVSLLLLQAIAVTLLSFVFLFMPSVGSSYWLLTVLASQLALIFYIFFFAAAIRLCYKRPHVFRSYRIPGGKFGMWVVAGTGIVASLFTIIAGFVPPTNVSDDNLMAFETFLIVGILVFCGLPWIIYRKAPSSKTLMDV